MSFSQNSIRGRGAMHIGFVQPWLKKDLRDLCECELKSECVPFKELPDDFNFCDRWSFPRSVCFERLGVVVHRPDSAVAPKAFSSSVFEHVFDESAFAWFDLPIASIKPLNQWANDLDWGAGAVGAVGSSQTGKGVKVCIVDSGVEEHPDLKVSHQRMRSFTFDPSHGDSLGHGTFNAGILCGARNPSSGKRFGIAPDAELFVAKVFDESGVACSVSLLAALEWALVNECSIVSMSIGKQRTTATSVRNCMAVAAQRALDQNLLIVAGAGNGSDRNRTPRLLAPVAYPANVPAIMAVAAVDKLNAPTTRSSVADPKTGAKIDIAAPGQMIRSTGAIDLYATASGTSVAAPHVAGVAALYAEACPERRGQALWDLVVSKATEIPNQSVSEVGAGLVAAPMKSDTCLCNPIPPCS